MISLAVKSPSLLTKKSENSFSSKLVAISLSDNYFLLETERLDMIIEWNMKTYALPE